MPDPYQQDEPISLAGMGIDAIGWATYRNPYFTTRMGTSGWDPRGRKWMSKLNAILAPGSNQAYGAFDDMASYGEFRDMSTSAKARDRSIRSARDASYRRNRDANRLARQAGREHARVGRNLEARMGQFHAQHLNTPSSGVVMDPTEGRIDKAILNARRQRQYGRMYETLEKHNAKRPTATQFGWGVDDIKAMDQDLARLGKARTIAKHEMARLGKGAQVLGMNADDAVAVARAPARTGGPLNRVIGITGERVMNARERHISGMAKKKMGGMKWLGQLFGKESTWGARHAAAAYGAGRVLTGVSLATLAHDVTKMALAPLQAFAEVGVTARAAPVLQTGAGLREPGAAATIRQQAIQRMQSSAFAPRNIIGQEAGFLHV